MITIVIIQMRVDFDRNFYLDANQNPFAALEIMLVHGYTSCIRIRCDIDVCPQDRCGNGNVTPFEQTRLMESGVLYSVFWKEVHAAEKTIPRTLVGSQRMGDN